MTGQWAIQCRPRHYLRQPFRLYPSNERVYKTYNSQPLPSQVVAFHFLPQPFCFSNCRKRLSTKHKVELLFFASILFGLTLRTNLSITMPPQSPTAPLRREDDGSRLDACIYQTIMALDMKENGQVGCAYYVVVDSALYLQEDIVTAGMEVVETLLFHVRPTVVITSNRVPEKLVEYLESNSSNDRGT